MTWTAFTGTAANPGRTGSVDPVHSVSVAAVEIRGARHRYPALVGSDLIEQIGKHARDCLVQGHAQLSRIAMSHRFFWIQLKEV